MRRDQPAPFDWPSNHQSTVDRAIWSKRKKMRTMTADDRRICPAPFVTHRQTPNRLRCFAGADGTCIHRPMRATRSASALPL